jgi:hypothetical protein
VELNMSDLIARAHTLAASQQALVEEIATQITAARPARLIPVEPSARGIQLTPGERHWTDPFVAVEYELLDIEFPAHGSVRFGVAPHEAGGLVPISDATVEIHVGDRALPERHELVPLVRSTLCTSERFLIALDARRVRAQMPRWTKEFRDTVVAALQAPRAFPNGTPIPDSVDPRTVADLNELRSTHGRRRDAEQLLELTWVELTRTHRRRTANTRLFVTFDNAALQSGWAELPKRVGNLIALVERLRERRRPGPPNPSRVTSPSSADR